MTEEPDYILDISGQQTPVRSGPGEISAGQGEARPYISVYFECCNSYKRIYRNREGTAYQGNCTQCLRPINVKIGPGGTSQRFFSAT